MFIRDTSGLRTSEQNVAQVLKAKARAESELSEKTILSKDAVNFSSALFSQPSCLFTPYCRKKNLYLKLHSQGKLHQD